MISTLTIYLFLHILGAFMLVSGSALGEATVAAMRRTRNAQTLLTLTTMASRVPMMTIPGALLTIIFGTLLIPLYGFTHSALWLNVAYVLWLIAVGLSVGILGPRERKLHQLAERDATAGTEASAELLEAVNNGMFRMVVHSLSAIILVFLLIMVFKPGN